MRLRKVKGAEERIAQSPYCKTAQHAGKGQFKRQGRALHVEIGMGKGQFLIEQAKRHPDIDFVGIERYESVLVRALDKLEDQESPLTNCTFLCIDAADLADWFEPGEIDQIYLNFSDPWPKDRHAKRRLTSERFLKRFSALLAPGGSIVQKTDNENLFRFSLEQFLACGWTVVEESKDLYHSSYLVDNVATEYEEKFVQRGNAICYCKASAPIKKTS